MMAAIMSLAACDSESTYETTSSRDCVVTSATLGTLYRMTAGKNTSGQDTVYRSAVSGVLYPLSIDHRNQRIFNADSLPPGTDVSRTVFAAFNATGTVGIRSLATGQDTLFTRTDSTDCSVERFVTVYSADGESRRTYSLQLNVHREEADSFVWRKVAAGASVPQALARGAMRLVSRAADRALLLYGTQGRQSVVTQYKDGVWTAPAPVSLADPLTVTVAGGDRFFALSADGALALSADGENWQPAAGAGPDRLVVAGGQLLVGMKDGAFVSSPDGGAGWTADAADEPRHLPVADVRGTVWQSTYDDRLEEYLVTGRDADGQTVVWRRTADRSAAGDAGWYYLPAIDDEAFRCPTLLAPQLFTYDGCTWLAGQPQADAAPRLYVSRDNGRTWLQGQLPFPVREAGAVAVAVDADHYIWVIDGRTGDLWRGRYNRLGWQQPPMSFE